MKCLTLLDPIEKMDLSTRAYNALRRADINTVGKLLDFPREDLWDLKNIGAKSVTEICEAIETTTIIPFEADAPISSDLPTATFIGTDGNMYNDIPIEDLELTKRPYNCLKNAGVNYFSQLQNMNEDELLAIPNMGSKSVTEICNKKAKTNLKPTCQSQSRESTLDDAYFCQRIVQNIIRKIPVNVGQLYDEILPLCKNCEDPICLPTLEIPTTLMQSIFALPILDRAIKKAVLHKLESAPYGVERTELFKVIPDCLMDETLLNTLLNDMEQEGSILCRQDQTFERQYQTALQYALSLPKEQYRKVLHERLLGKTLDEIGKECSLTRERVRQIEAKCLRKAPKLLEDRYAQIYQKYEISKEDFMMGFRESAITFNYLSSNYKHGNHPLEELVSDPEVPDEFRRAAERVLYKNYVVLNGERVLCCRSELSEYVLRTAGTEGLTFEEYAQFYQMLLEDLGLKDNPKLSIMERGYENRLAASNHILWKYGQKLRFYNIDSYDFSDFFERLDLQQYNNIEFSTLKLFREYPDLMKDYDIQDEYELHNLLKKICSKDDFPNLHFKRMPNIEFGTADRDSQVMELLITLAPVENTKLADAYEHEYGVLSQTVLANYLKNFDQYFYAGAYKIDFPALPEIMETHMKRILSGEFYFLSDIRRMYEHEFPKSDSKLINTFSLKSMGFRVYANYAISDKYSSATEYFRAILTTDDIVDTNSFSKELLNTVAYTAEVYKLKVAYEIIEYVPLKYVNMRRLKHVGICEDTLADYCEKVYKAVGTQYFTVCSLQQSGFTHALDDLGFDEWFYASLLAEDKSHFSYRRMGKNKLFRRGNENVYLADFLEWLLYSNDSLSIDIYDLMELLQNGYNINIEQYKIIETIKGSSMYYDTITEKIYADYDVYFEEI